MARTTTKTAAAAPAAAEDPETKVEIRLLAEVRFDEWFLTFQADQVTEVKAGLLADKRFNGKFERI